MKGITETIQRIRSIKIKMTRNSSDSKRNVPKINAPKIKGRIGHEIECEKKETSVKDARKQKNAEAVKKPTETPYFLIFSKNKTQRRKNYRRNMNRGNRYQAKTRKIRENHKGDKIEKKRI